MGRICVPWTIREIGLLRQLAQEKGLSAKRIHEAGALPRHGQNSIKSRMSSLDLGNPEIKRRIKEARRMSSEEKSLLLDFLQKKGRHTPSEEVACKFGIKPQMVYYYRKKLGLKLESPARFSSKRFQEARCHNMTKLREGLRKYHDSFWKGRSEQLFALFRKTAIVGTKAELLQCKNCRSFWFATTQFFYRARTMDDGTVHLRTLCRACGHVA